MRCAAPLWMILLMGVFAACVPAAIPEQLAQTPGPAVRVIDGLYDSGQFQIQIPPGWRVITSAAGDPVRVIFAAPEGDALIAAGAGVDEAPAPAGYSGPLRSERREIPLSDDVTVTVILNAAPEGWDSRLALFENLVRSVRES